MDDPELIRLLATRGMGWEVYPTSHHRPGTRPHPHAWLWRRPSGVRLMVYDGRANREWNPLANAADADELAAASGVPRSPESDPREYATALGEALAARAEKDREESERQPGEREEHEDVQG